MRMGTLGADIFKNKILVIDYPHKRFCVMDSIPPSFNFKLENIEINKNGKVVLPMKLNGKILRVMFDNGSSIFPLITSEDKTDVFSHGKITDSIRITSWGREHTVTGKPLNGTLEFGGHSFSKISVYTDHRPDQKSDYAKEGIDAITGNALFWDKTIIIDFKRQKFGIN